MEVGTIETLKQIKTEEELKTRIIGVIEEADRDQDRGQKEEKEEENEVGGNEGMKTLEKYNWVAPAILPIDMLISTIFLRISLGPKAEVLMERGIGGVEEVVQNHMRCAIEGKMTSVTRISDETGRKRACPR